MALYEGNFIKLHALVPRIAPRFISYSQGDRSRPLPVPFTAVSVTPLDLDLHLSLESATRYTLDLRLSYVFREPRGAVADPDLRLRVYLDARMVEVLGWSVSPRHDLLRELWIVARRNLDRRWAENMMLAKWLEYLTERGHAFPA